MTEPDADKGGKPDVRLKKADYDHIAEARYLVEVNGTYIGDVTKRRTESWRYSRSGTYRTSLRGRPVHWEAEPVGNRWGQHRTRYYTRADAIAGLLDLARAALDGTGQ